MGSDLPGFVVESIERPKPEPQRLVELGTQGRVKSGVTCIFSVALVPKKANQAAPIKSAAEIIHRAFTASYVTTAQPY
jgi:hypothetical protein